MGRGTLDSMEKDLRLVISYLVMVNTLVCLISVTFGTCCGCSYMNIGAFGRDAQNCGMFRLIFDEMDIVTQYHTLTCLSP
jgi:hypothetical protein